MTFEQLLATTSFIPTNQFAVSQIFGGKKHQYINHTKELVISL